MADERLTVEEKNMLNGISDPLGVSHYNFSAYHSCVERIINARKTALLERLPSASHISNIAVSKINNRRPSIEIGEDILTKVKEAING